MASSRSSFILPCNHCDFAARTLATLAKHSRTNHALSFRSDSSSSALPMHSSRNNSFAEVQLQENMSITNLSSLDKQVLDPKKNEVLKYTCLDCEYKTKVKSHMEKHVKSIHMPEAKDVNFVCGTCDHEFVGEENYNIALHGAVL